MLRKNLIPILVFHSSSKKISSTVYFIIIALVTLEEVPYIRTNLPPSVGEGERADEIVDVTFKNPEHQVKVEKRDS